MRLDIDVSEEFGRAFGFRPRYQMPGAAPGAGAPGYAGIRVLEKPEAVAASRLGTPIFDRVSFAYSSNGQIREYTPDFPPLMSTSTQKAAKSTPINEGDGVGHVVESSGNGQTVVTLRGLLVDMGAHQHPVGQMEQLNEFYLKNRPIEVYSKLLNALKIKDAYLNSLDTEQIEGYRDTVRYTLTLTSYIPAQLVIEL